MSVYCNTKMSPARPILAGNLPKPGSPGPLLLPKNRSGDTKFCRTKLVLSCSLVISVPPAVKCEFAPV